MRYALVIVLVLVATTAVWAQTTPVDVCYSGDLVLRIRTGIGPATPERRAICVRQHLAEAINAVFATEDEVFDPATVVVKRSSKQTPCEYTIWAGSVLIIGISKADAEANGCCPKQLAEKWQKNIRNALTKATHDC